MAAPNPNVDPFQKGETLTASHLEQVRVLAVEVARWLVSSGFISPDKQTPVTAIPVEIGGVVGEGTGVYDGRMHYPPIKPVGSVDELAAWNLGKTGSHDSSGTVVDAEVWDLAALAGIHLGHYAGRNEAGRPILIVDSGAQIIPQYAGMFDGAPVANTLAALFIPAVNSIPST